MKIHPRLVAGIYLLLSSVLLFFIGKIIGVDIISTKFFLPFECISSFVVYLIMEKNYYE